MFFLFLFHDLIGPFEIQNIDKRFELRTDFQLVLALQGFKQTSYGGNYGCMPLADQLQVSDDVIIVRIYAHRFL
jgi:hypothetical protein